MTNQIKILGRPLGVWLAWVALVYAAALAVWGVIDLVTKGQGDLIPTLSDVLVAWPILIAAIVALARRRFFARLLGGMAMAFLLYQSIVRLDPVGIILALLGFWGLVSNRRWFDEKLPKLGW